MTANERLEALLNRFGQTISDLPAGDDTTFAHSDFDGALVAIAEYAHYAIKSGDDIVVPRIALDYILHLTDVIDRMEWALEDAVPIERFARWMSRYATAPVTTLEGLIDLSAGVDNIGDVNRRRIVSFVAHPAPNPPEFANVKEQRLRGDDLQRILGLYAADAELGRACEDERIRERMRLLPNGWRDLRMVRAALRRLTDAIQWTVPMEKRVGLERTASRCRFMVMQGPLASKPKNDEDEVITTHELDELVSSAWEGRCQMCVDGQCDRCDLGKVLDSVVAIDRAGGCWGTMDIRRRDA